MKMRPPDLISLHVADLCRQINSSGAPVFITINSEPGCEVNDCFQCVKDKVAREGDRIQFERRVAQPRKHYVIHTGCTRRAKAIIAGVEFVVDDATRLFCDTDALGWLVDARPFIDDIIQAAGQGRSIPTGPEPRICYFSGKTEIFSVSTAIGKVSASHQLPLLPVMFWQRPLPNRVAVVLEFSAPVIFDEAIFRACRLVEYLGLIVGRPQTLLDMEVRITSSREHPVYLGLHWSYAPQRDRSKECEDRPHPFHMLLDGSQYRCRGSLRSRR